MSGLYIHIPFCKQRCLYCDFYSSVGNAKAAMYVNALVRELDARCYEIDLSQVNTLYVGGGTPSFLSIPLLEQLCNAVGEYLDFEHLDEATIEVNPEDVTCEYASAIARLGFSRVSMGVQSMIDSELKAVNRRHSATRVVEAIATLRSAGINNISVDLIYGLPGQTLESWQSSIEQVIELKPQHISAYSLMLSEGTALYKLWQRGKFTEVSDDTYIKMYHMLISMMKEHGYEHYEISNFALPGYHSRHNSSYWTMTPYLGLGASAYSWDGVVRRANIGDIDGYINAINSGEPAFEEEVESLEERYNDYILTGMRTIFGVDLEFIRSTFGEQFSNHFIKNVHQFIENGAVASVGKKYRITEQGMMLSDAVIRELIMV